MSYLLYPFGELRGYLIDVKHKTIPGQSSELLSGLNQADQSCFSLEDAYHILKKSNNDAVRLIFVSPGIAQEVSH